MRLATREIEGILSSEVLDTINSPFFSSRLLRTYHVLKESDKLRDENLSVSRECLPASCPRCLRV